MKIWVLYAQALFLQATLGNLDKSYFSERLSLDASPLPPHVL